MRYIDSGKIAEANIYAKHKKFLTAVEIADDPSELSRLLDIVLMYCGVKNLREEETIVGASYRDGIIKLMDRAGNFYIRYADKRILDDIAEKLQKTLALEKGGDSSVQEDRSTYFYICTHCNKYF